ncbi:MAG: DUF302 domain-containing protein [Hyphomicrobiaceae bacterium]|nr:DUF302 domain-containing protein [Hyphomicrobiaceae bacterium]
MPTIARSIRGASSVRAFVCLAASALAVTAGIGAGPAKADDILKRVTKKAEFADARTDLQNAIINQGLKIDYNGRIGEMLKRTGSDVGSSKEIYTDAEYFTFCSSKLSRAMMEADPINMGMCPYMMFVYAAPDKPGEVTIGYRAAAMRGNEASHKALTDINALLDTILKEASE